MFTLEVEEGLSLKLVEQAFALHYLDIVNQQRIYLSEWLIWPQLAADESFFVEFIHQAQDDYIHGRSIVCAMLFHGELVGNICFKSIDRESKSVEIGYWLSQTFQGRGIVTKSVSALVDYAFTRLDMETIEIFAAVENRRSLHVCERLGFTFEHVINQAEVLHGRSVDHVAYALTISQWREKKYISPNACG